MLRDYEIPLLEEMLQEEKYQNNIPLATSFVKDFLEEYKKLKKLLANNTIKPYKFEELKPKTWVWDNVAKECLYVIKPFVSTVIGVKCFSYLGIYKNLEEIRKLDMKFEENRFYPVQMANLMEVG